MIGYCENLEHKCRMLQSFLDLLAYETIRTGSGTELTFCKMCSGQNKHHQPDCPLKDYLPQEDQNVSNHPTHTRLLPK